MHSAQTPVGGERQQSWQKIEVGRLSLSLSLRPFISLSLCLSVTLSISLSVSVSRSVSLSVSLCLSLSLWLSPSFSLSFSLSLCFSLSVSVSLPGSQLDNRLPSTKQPIKIWTQSNTLARVRSWTPSSPGWARSTLIPVKVFESPSLRVNSLIHPSTYSVQVQILQSS